MSCGLDSYQSSKKMVGVNSRVVHAGVNSRVVHAGGEENR